jgi:glycosyltransferase involved in cell wall biosynthesis
VWYAKKRKIPHYIYVQDLWPENVETVLGIHSKLIIEPINKMVDYIYKNSAKIFVTSESFRENVSARVDDVDKVIYLPQYAEEIYTPKERTDVEEIPLNKKFKIIFTGNIGYAQGLDILPKTAEILKTKGCADIQFVLVGEGRYKQKLIEEIESRGVSEQFVLVDRQPAERIPALLAACNVAFLSFMDSPLFEMTIPAKLQSYMACGMPVVASASGETARIIAEANCGICCPLGDAEALADALVKMQKSENLTEMSQNSIAYNKANFNKAELISMLETELCGKIESGAVALTGEEKK